jgi:hypothetical protein
LMPVSWKKSFPKKAKLIFGFFIYVNAKKII